MPENSSPNGVYAIGSGNARIQIADQHAGKADSRKPPAAAHADINTEHEGNRIRAERQLQNCFRLHAVADDRSADTDGILRI